ncbi:hypothetical protein ACFLRC_03660 [Candidatus Altiarchaeota archaeon]
MAGRIKKKIDKKIDKTADKIHEATDKKKQAFDEKIDKAADKLKNINVSACCDFKNMSKKIDNIYDQYELEKRQEELKKAMDDLEVFVREHPWAGLALGASVGYMFASVFRRR